MRIATTGKLAVFATAVSMLVSGAAFAQGATPATPATPANHTRDRRGAEAGAGVAHIP